MHKKFWIFAVIGAIAAQSIFALSAQQKDTVNEYVATQRYLTAMRYLNNADPNSTDPDAVVLETKLAVNDSVVSINDTIFGFRDLAPGETVTSARKAGGSSTMLTLNIPDMVNPLLKQDPASGALNDALGSFYADVTLRCRCLDQFPNSPALAIQYYQKATVGGTVTAENQGQMALIALKGGNYQLARDSYLRALQLEPANPDDEYNLAFALLNLSQYDLASKYAQEAYVQYSDPQPKRDAHLMYGDALLFGGNPTAALVVYRDIAQTESTNLFVMRRLIQCYLQLNDISNLTTWFTTYLKEAGTNPNEVAALSGIFQTQGGASVFVTVADSEIAGTDIPNDKGGTATRGILSYYEAFAYQALGDNQKYADRLKQARSLLQNVYPASSPIFPQIDRDLQGGS